MQASGESVLLALTTRPFPVDGPRTLARGATRLQCRASAPPVGPALSPLHCRRFRHRHGRFQRRDMERACGSVMRSDPSTRLEVTARLRSTLGYRFGNQSPRRCPRQHRAPERGRSRRTPGPAQTADWCPLGNSDRAHGVRGPAALTGAGQMEGSGQAQPTTGNPEPRSLGPVEMRRVSRTRRPYSQRPITPNSARRMPSTTSHGELERQAMDFLQIGMQLRRALAKVDDPMAGAAGNDRDRVVQRATIPREHSGEIKIGSCSQTDACNFKTPHTA